MADTKLSNLTALTAPASGDFMEVLDISDTSMAAAGTNKKMDLSHLLSGLSIYSAGGTDVAVADGGTGSSTASGARTNLGLGSTATPGTDVQAWDADLDSLASVGYTDWTTWSGAWTNLTKGSGGSFTETYEYVQLGKTVLCRFALVIGTAGSPAVGTNPTLSTPVNANTTIGTFGNPVGRAKLTCASTIYNADIVYQATGTVSFRVHSYDPTAGAVAYTKNVSPTSAIPGTWTPGGDILTGTFWYRAA